MIMKDMEKNIPEAGRLVVLGGGESGVGAAILGKDKGWAGTLFSWLSLAIPQ